jgi:hypothetical protein
MTVSRIPNVEGGIQPTLVTAKGDLIAAVANASPGRLGVGSDGQLLTADSSSATGLSYQNNWAAGKNKIINGDFEVWQRGTSFNLSSVTGYTADRWQLTWNGSGATRTISRQTFTPGSAPVAGYEGEFFWRYNQSVAGTGGAGNYFFQPIEDVRTFAGQTVTASFWAKADASRSVPVALEQNFGSGGSGGTSTSLGTASITTSWTRFTFSVAVPSISGKTIGTSSYLNFLMTFPANTVQTIDIWGVQLEQGSTATAFQTATGTIQGELAACQRYFFALNQSNGVVVGTGSFWSSTQCNTVITFPSTMRVAPSFTSSSSSALTIYRLNGNTNTTAIALDSNSINGADLALTTSSTTAGTASFVRFTGSNNYLWFSSEL